MSQTAVRVITFSQAVAGFMEDKDFAKEVRNAVILPALIGEQNVVLDFAGVNSSTQSFMHALLGEALKRYGESVLDRFEFRNCTPRIKNLVRLVVDYSLGGFEIEENSDNAAKRHESEDTRVTTKRRKR